MNKCLWINGKEVGMSEKAGLTAEDVLIWQIKKKLKGGRERERSQNFKLPDV